MNGIFDTHAHYDDAAFDNDRDALLAAMPAHGVCGIINCAVDRTSAETSIMLSERYPFMWAAVGAHPENLETATADDLALYRQLLSHKKVVAVGEIGLDYHWDASPREVQRRWFSQQLKLANDCGKPVIIHDREAHEDTLALLKEHQPRGVLHCFSGSVELLREVLKLGMYIGLGGAVTFKGAKKPLAVAAAVPLDRLLLETDAPYMAPVPLRGQRCDSTQIAYAAQTIADIRGITTDELLRQTAANARTLFHL